MELEPPPPLPGGGLRVIPLGGLGAIGRNMTVFEYDGKLLIVDCGVLFPDVDQPGVDLILPDFYADPGPARRRAGDRAHPRARGPHRRGARTCWRTRRTSRWSAPQFTLALVEAKLRRAPHRAVHADRERGPDRSGSARSSASSSRSTTRSRTRSAVAVRTPAGVVLHTGDFKMDQLPLDGRLTDLAGFARLGAAGVDLLLSDSTNAEVPGFVTPEREHRPGARLDLRARPPAGSSWPRFASHVHRVQQVLDAAHAHDRKVAFIGRSMVRNMGIARDLGLLRDPGRPAWSASTRRPALPRGQIVLMSTGSQGEPMSALGRMADRRPPRTSRSSRATPWCWPARWCRATRPRSTG